MRPEKITKSPSETFEPRKQLWQKCGVNNLCCKGKFPRWLRWWKDFAGKLIQTKEDASVEMGVNPDRLKILGHVALYLGPFLIAAGIFLLASELYESRLELQSHILRIIHRDQKWDPIVHEIHDTITKYNAVLGEMKNRQEEVLVNQRQIISNQHAILALLEGKKLGSIVKYKEPNLMESLSCDWSSK